MTSGPLIYGGISLVIGLILMPLVLPVLIRLKFGQVIRKSGPKRHFKKAGTPTMGGLVFLAAAVLTFLILGTEGRYQLAALIITLAYGLLGFADDYLKVVLKRPLGLLARQKLLVQFLIGTALYFYLRTLAHSTVVAVPFTGLEIELGILYLPLLILVLTASTNAVNITDGLDGLAGGTSLIALAGYAVIAVAAGQPELSLFAAALIGALGAFLVYNIHPARVIMGDTGSLALGGALGTMAILTKTELFLVIIGGLFVIESLSVIVQVTYFRLTNGRRLLRMSPLHHHFELVGMSEQAIVLMFWVAELLFVILGVFAAGASASLF